MSDLCHDDGAQEACVSCAEKALQYDPRNVQAMQVRARQGACANVLQDTGGRGGQ